MPLFLHLEEQVTPSIPLKMGSLPDLCNLKRRLNCLRTLSRTVMAATRRVTKVGYCRWSDSTSLW